MRGSMPEARQPLLVVLLLGAALSGCLGASNQASVVQTPGPTGGGATVGSLHVDFTFEPSNPGVGQAVQFTDKSRDDELEVVETAWDFGDNTASTAPNPTHVYQAAGVYKVVLHAWNSARVQANASRLIAVHAGGGLPPTTPPVGIPPIPQDFMSFGTPVKVQADRGGEPSVAIDGKGHIYLSPIGELYKSTNGGKSFAAVNYPQTVSGDSHVVVDANDRVYIADLQGFGVGVGVGPAVPILGPTAVWSSGDGGASWVTSGNPAASDSVLNDRQWLAAKGNGLAYLLFKIFPCCAKITKTTDSGVTWIPLSSSWDWDSFPFINPKDGTLYVVSSEGSNGETVRVHVSPDGGSTWTSALAAQRHTTTSDMFASGTVDDAGNAYVTWSDKESGQYNVYLAYSTDRGAKWKGPFLVSAGVGTHLMPWIAAGGDGKVVVTWYGTNKVGDPNAMDANTEWYVYAAQSLNAHDKTPVFSQSQASPGSIHKGAVCLGGLSCSADRDLLDFFTIDVAPDGRAAIAYGQDDGGSTTASMFVYQTGGPLNR